MDFVRFKWMMRVIALIEFFMLAIANFGKDFHVKLSRHWLSSVTSRLSDEDSIPLGRLVPSSPGTISRNLRSMRISLVVCLSTLGCLRVGCTTLSLSLFRD